MIGVHNYSFVESTQSSEPHGRFYDGNQHSCYVKRNKSVKVKLAARIIMKNWILSENEHFSNFGCKCERNKQATVLPFAPRISGWDRDSELQTAVLI